VRRRANVDPSAPAGVASSRRRRAPALDRALEEVVMRIASPDSVTVRLDRLERENRRWRRLALASWLVIAAVGLLGQSAPPSTRPPSASRVIEGERFVLRDAGGRVGATLAWEPSDTPRLALHDPAGKPRAVLNVAVGGSPGLTLLDADGQTTRAALVVGPDGAPGLALFDPAGKPRLAAALFHPSSTTRAARQREPTPAMVVYDATGAVRVTVGLRASEAAGLELADARGAARALVSVKTDGTPDLTLRDGDGRARATLGVLADGAPAFNLNGPDGRARAALTLVPDKGAALALADRHGAVVWSAP
jgi:hypothetical protein